MNRTRDKTKQGYALACEKGFRCLDRAHPIPYRLSRSHAQHKSGKGDEMQGRADACKATARGRDALLGSGTEMLSSF